MSIKTNPVAKGVLLVVGAYVVTVGVAVFITSLTIMILMVLEPLSCSDMSWVMLMLWVTIAAMFLISVVVIGVVARKVIPGVTRRVCRAIVVTHGVAMLASYVVIAFGLMVAFNC